jgi:DNA-binding response OmpR family regulator
MLPTVLVVDRDVDLVLATFARLDAAGYQVATATTPLGALAAADALRPTIAFVSCGLALWACSLIVDRPPDDAVHPTVMLTGRGARRHWRPLGAHGYLGEPVTADRILRIVERLRRPTPA